MTALLSDEKLTGRCGSVGTMDVEVTIGARSPYELAFVVSPGSIEGVEIDMALPAQPDFRSFQHPRIVAAMGIMTVRAIFRDRGMLEEKGAAFLLVARVA